MTQRVTRGRWYEWWQCERYAKRLKLHCHERYDKSVVARFFPRDYPCLRGTFQRLPFSLLTQRGAKRQERIEGTTMQDINHNPLRVGDHIRTSTYRDAVIEAQVSTEVVRIKVPNGSKVDIHLRLNQAEFIAPTSYNGVGRGGR